MVSSMTCGACVLAIRTFTLISCLSSGRLRLVRLSFANTLLGRTTMLDAPVSRYVERQVVSNDASFRAVAQHDPVAERVGTPQRQRNAGKDVAKRVLQRKPDDDGNHARRCRQRCDGNAEDETRYRQRHAEIDDSDDQFLEQARFSRPMFHDDIEAHKADKRPGKVYPPEDARRLCQIRALKIGLSHPMRQDSAEPEHCSHAGEEQDLDDQACHRAPTALEIPDDNAGKPQKIDQDQGNGMMIAEHGSPIG